MARLPARLALVAAALWLQGCVAFRETRTPVELAEPDSAKPTLTLTLAVDGIERVMPGDGFLEQAEHAGKIKGGNHACMFGNERIEEAARAAYERSQLFSKVSADPSAQADLHAFVRLRCLVGHSWTYFPFGLSAGIWPHHMEVGLLSTSVLVRKGLIRGAPLNDVRLLRADVWADTLLLLVGGWRESPGTALAELATRSQREVIYEAKQRGLLAVPPARPGG